MRELTLIVVALLLCTACAGDDGDTSPSGSDRAATTTTTITTLPPTTTPVGPELREPSPVVGAGPETGDAVALTFDADLTPGMQQKLRDGRARSYANLAIIDMLRATNTPATIFFTGVWMEEYPDVTQDIAADARFELATHSQTHRAFRPDCWGLEVVPQEEMAAEVRMPIETLDRLTGRATRYFRFPGLCHDETALAEIASEGVTVVDGESSGDAGATSAAAIVTQTLNQVRPGSIIVMHLNGGDAAPHTAEALGPIIEGLRANGLRLVTMSALLGEERTG